MNPRVEQQTPILQQGRRAVARRQALPVRTRKEQQHRRQFAASLDAQLLAIGDGEQALPCNDVAFAMRHLQARTGQPTVFLDDAAKDARRDQQSGRVRARQKPL